MKIILCIKIKTKCYRNKDDEKVLTIFLCADSYQFLHIFHYICAPGTQPVCKSCLTVLSVSFTSLSPHTTQPAVTALPVEWLEASYDAKIKRLSMPVQFDG
jgi:hypothetical protein